ncbi:predicted protein [Uncinocarpus reesii 1704]|uniref:Tryptophan synthase beta chain-like PALP domain-containing protein n=1 Tax=Uncinocarpus reesii (strain UAMH 1704) TaxID=336963 RepID=C4JY08_UNCRE|nr:uncharacterized protein UREG_07059 [Uncinocarpus reesii 1704]EEP82194.1 predicted protein [Uncinocarpus reesii 1704]
MSSSIHPLYINPNARSCNPQAGSPRPLRIRQFHQSLPSYSPSPLVPLSNLAKSLGVKGIFIKDESSRFGLPSFKILGASWGTFRALVDFLQFPLEAALQELANAAQAKSIKLFAATDGNHGRAVARMAKLLGIHSQIYVPECLGQYTRDLIASEEGCTVIVVDGDYDMAVHTANEQAKRCPNGILIQDTSFTGYETIPAWIVEGYSTMLEEIDSQLAHQSLTPTLVITPVGVGSLAHAVVSHCKAADPPVSVLTVEPDTAACLHTSLIAGKMTPFKTTGTIMNGLDCGTVSLTAWPTLRDGVNASTTVSDLDSHRAVEDLASQGIHLGPCGAAGLAALQRIAADNPGCLGLGPDCVVVILGTEGTRPYPVPIPVDN